MRINRTLSDPVCSSTGSPQGCVLSPLLFILYTNMCRSQYENRLILKYADDSVVVSLLRGGESSHGPVIDDFLRWCDDSYLQINVSKTKDMFIDFRRQAHSQEALTIKGQTIEQVTSYKYLGTVIDSTLNFDLNCEAVCKKGHQRLHCLRKLSSFNIDKTMMSLFYCAFIESILTFSLASWFGNISLKNKNSLNKIVKWSGKLIGEPQPNMEALYTKLLQRLSKSVQNENTHPLNSVFQLLPSRQRLKVPQSRTNLYRNSFVPAAIIYMNKLLQRH